MLLGFLVNVAFWLFDLVFMRFVWFGWFIDLVGLFAFQFALAGCGLGVVLLLIVAVSLFGMLIVLCTWFFAFVSFA